MCPIEADVSFYNQEGEFIQFIKSVTVTPGDTKDLEGQKSVTEIACNLTDNGGTLSIIEAAKDVRRDGLFGLGGFFGPKKITVIDECDKGSIVIKGKNGYDLVSFKHIPPNDHKIPLRHSR